MADVSGTTVDSYISMTGSKGLRKLETNYSSLGPTKSYGETQESRNFWHYRIYYPDRGTVANVWT